MESRKNFTIEHCTNIQSTLWHIQYRVWHWSHVEMVAATLTMSRRPRGQGRGRALLLARYVPKRAITSEIKHAIKHKTSPARLAQLLQPSLAFCFSTGRCAAIGYKLKQNANEGCNSCATVVQVLQDLFYVLLHVLFYLWSLLNV